MCCLRTAEVVQPHRLGIAIDIRNCLVSVSTSLQPKHTDECHRWWYRIVFQSPTTRRIVPKTISDGHTLSSKKGPTAAFLHCSVVQRLCSRSGHFSAVERLCGRGVMRILTTRRGQRRNAQQLRANLLPLEGLAFKATNNNFLVSKHHTLMYAGRLKQWHGVLTYSDSAYTIVYQRSR